MLYGPLKGKNLKRQWLGLQKYIHQHCKKGPHTKHIRMWAILPTALRGSHTFSLSFLVKNLYNDQAYNRHSAFWGLPWNLSILTAIWCSGIWGRYSINLPSCRKAWAYRTYDENWSMFLVWLLNSVERVTAGWRNPLLSLHSFTIGKVIVRNKTFIRTFNRY